MGQHQQLAAGFICTDTDLLERNVRIITSIQRFKLTALWCPDAEKSLQLAAEFDIPAVSHTAYQLMCRADVKTVIIAGYPNHNIVFCIQAQALKKDVICVGCLAVSLRSAQILEQFLTRFNSSTFCILYPLKYSKPVALLRMNVERLGLLHSVTAEYCFQEPSRDNKRLMNDAPTLLHMYGHELIDTVASICKSDPQRNAVTYNCKTSVVQHFRLKELDSAHMQVVLGTVVASIRLTCSLKESLAIHVQGDQGILQLDASCLKLECNGSQSTLWQGDGSFESVLRDGLINALSTENLINGPSELSIVQCIEKESS